MTEPPVTSDRPDRARLVGAGAIAVAVGVVAENVVLAAAGAPGYDTPMDEVARYFAAQRGAVGVAAGLVAVYLPLLLLLVTGLHGIVERRGGAGAAWSRLAVAAGAAASAGFVLANVLQVGLAISADGLTRSSPAFELVWHVHAAAFAFVLPMLGATAVGLALAAHASGLTRSWLRVLGLAAGGLMLVAGVGALAVADGSPLLFVGLLGLTLWLGWLVATGVRLVRWGGRSR
ncbi:hypothetical protein HL663_04955 [Arthrobacter sp. NEB 688]|nr:hypothetical protein HL663_04955 [Arthrobacter sp. NEB 688]